ncbi:MAG: hypothetical protein DMG87_19035 [Acidobacteria bacterium]|nr:MAG: hypothetical protein DMG87_19035 [Acidobacteriota bacterium]
MLFMVIENFRNGDAVAVGKRFKQSGRMLPEGVDYQASWVDSGGMRCFQIMEARDSELSFQSNPLLTFGLKCNSIEPDLAIAAT